jgi:CubicO group peptidase (beta-lactamase class C family)
MPAINLRILILTSLLLVVSACTATDNRTSKARDITNRFLAESGYPGIAVTVSIDGEIAWSEGFGYADVEQKVPVSPSLTRFRVGSTAKSMTAMAVAKLVESGKLDLDAPIQQYLPDYPEKAGVITARLLGGHLAGIRHYNGDEFLSAEHYATVRDGLGIFKDDPLIAVPGAEFNYSSYGFNLLSAVVESAAQQEFLSLMKETVFEAVGMEQTIADHVLPIIANRSRYYEVQDGEVYNSPWVDNSYKWAGGGILSTSEDLVRFGNAHLTDQYLKPGTIEMLWTPQRTTAGEETGYGIGWASETDADGRRVVRHSGGSVGGTTNLRIFPDNGMVIAVITNTSAADIGLLTDELIDVFLSPQKTL